MAKLTDHEYSNGENLDNDVGGVRTGAAARQMLPGLALTPDVQVILDPALNPAESAIAVFGVRARLAF